MNDIDIVLRLRPTRFAFLVRPENKQALKKIFQINTCIWGGTFNPVIPFFSSRPVWWDRNGGLREDPTQITKGYIKFFKPDFIVETERGTAKKFGVSEKYVLWIDDILSQNNQTKNGYGLNAFHVYKSLFHEVFKFTMRSDIPCFNIVTNDKDLELFSAAIFGSFPDDGALNYIKSAYDRVFDPKQQNITSKLLLDSFDKELIFPLKISAYKLQDIDQFSRWDPVILIIDPTKPNDLIDMWNLRIFRRNFIVIPITWLNDCRDIIKNKIINSFKSFEQNGLMALTTVMIGRSFGLKVREKIIKLINADCNGRVVFEVNYPRIWCHSLYLGRPDAPVQVEAKSLKTIAKISNDERKIIAINGIHPDFVEGWSTEELKWANEAIFSPFNNVINPGVIVDNLEYDNFPRNDYSLSYNKDDVIRTNGRTIAFFPSHVNLPTYMPFYNGTELFMDWLKIYGIESLPSRPGRIMTQMLNALKSFMNVRFLQDDAIVTTLNTMTVNGIRAGGDETTLDKWRDIAKQAKCTLRKDNVDFHLERLCELNVLHPGIRIECTVCGEFNWYPVDDGIKLILNCTHCFNNFNFPVARPHKNAIWSYRSQGPFAVKNFALGSYTSIFAIKFLRMLLEFGETRVTWTCSLNQVIKGKNGGEKELFDFAMWWQPGSLHEKDVKLIFGESKSKAKDCFKSKDIRNMKKLAVKFPGSTIIFATLKSALDDKEKRAIRNLAEWGRKFDKRKRSFRADVVVLTANELYSKKPWLIAWNALGGKHASLMATFMHQEDILDQLSNFTQQVYLDMECKYKLLMQSKVKT